MKNRICKVCHYGHSQENPLCYPCRCKGSIKFIHKECLFLFIESSNKTFCTICKHQFVLKDVFKPDTPEKVPFKLVLKGIFRLINEYTFKIGTNLLSIIVFLLIFLVNGNIMLYSSGKTFQEMITPRGILSSFILGLVTTFSSYCNYNFFFSLCTNLEQIVNRRVIRIDPLSAMNSIATDLITMTDSEIDGTARTLFTTITQSLMNEEGGEGRNVNEERRNEEENVVRFTNEDESTVNNSATVNNLATVNNSATVNNPATVNNSATVNNPSFNINDLIDPIIGDYNDASSDDTIIAPEDSITIPESSFTICFSSIFKGVNVSLLWWVVSFISIRLNFELPSSSFLSGVYLETITKKFIILYFLIIIFIGIVKSVNTFFNYSHSYYTVLKIYHLVYINFLYFLYFKGVIVHYAFSTIFNNSKSCLSLESSYFREYKTFLSIFFHLIVGNLVSFLTRKTLLLFKNKFRRGVLYFIVQPPFNDVPNLHQKAQENILSCIFQRFLKGITTLIVSKYIFYILRGAFLYTNYSKMSSDYSITSVNKALLLFKLLDLVSESFSFFHKQVACLVNRVIKGMALFLGMSNYLYGVGVRKDGNYSNLDLNYSNLDLSRFKWLPNTHKFYQPTSVKKRYYKKVTVKDLLSSREDGRNINNNSGNNNNNSGNNNINNNNNNNNINTTTTSSYSIYYVPYYFKFKCLLILSVSLTIFVYFYFSLFRLSNFVAAFFNFEKFFDNSSDVLLIVVSGVLLQSLRLFFYLVESPKSSAKPFLDDFVTFSKSFILQVFSLVVWPLWSTFIILVLYSESLKFVYPGRLISLLFSSSSLITFILNKVLFLTPIRNYSFNTIFKKLYGFMTVMTFLIVSTALLRTYSFVVIIETSEIPFLLIFGTSALLFYLKHCIKRIYNTFLENIKREHYLIDRNVENYEDKNK